jgi:hypothetical protein
VNRCIRVENPGEGEPYVFDKIPRVGGSRLSKKIAGGGVVPLFRVFLHFY